MRYVLDAPDLVIGGLSLDPILAFGGLLAGLLVGLTGMGGAALVTPAQGARGAAGAAGAAVPRPDSGALRQLGAGAPGPARRQARPMTRRTAPRAWSRAQGSRCDCVDGEKRLKEMILNIGKFNGTKAAMETVVMKSADYSGRG